MSIYKPEQWHFPQAETWVDDPANILDMVKYARRSYTRGFMAHASGKQRVSLSGLPEDLRASREYLQQLTRCTVDWFNDMRGNDLFVEGMYDRATTVELGSRGMVEYATPTPEWGRDTFIGVGTIAGASLQEAGLFTEDCVVELHTYPRKEELHAPALAMPLAAMSWLDLPSNGMDAGK